MVKDEIDCNSRPPCSTHTIHGIMHHVDPAFLCQNLKHGHKRMRKVFFKLFQGIFFEGKISYEIRVSNNFPLKCFRLIFSGSFSYSAENSLEVLFYNTDRILIESYSNFEFRSLKGFTSQRATERLTDL